ncbi:hypothetical protein FK529_05600 [Tsukamurella asaccharolytica]|uniref:Uncharacterized protein n=1 Tax=Tsukamurella asaccharolytica TaxID=2592067 RepID=A0A5C5RCI5_9ACTN|nr:hypothetical protein [Tsukamurella asaccharolytica]TWS20797.1 hypothetical protein FK529_05600 [Tsukamurella asaccharolytica]
MFDQITIPQVITWIALTVAIAACAGTVHYARRAEAAARRAQAAAEHAQRFNKWAHIHTVRADQAAASTLSAALRAESAAARIPAWGFGAGSGGAGAPSGFGGGTPSPMGEPGRGGGAVTNRIEFGGPVTQEAVNEAIRRGQSARRTALRDPFFAKASEAARANTVIAKGRDSVDRLLAGEGHDAVGTADDAAEADR